MALVVSAILVDNGRLLTAQRSHPPALAGKWELPGGKVEEGEVPLEALRRELREELGIEIDIGPELRPDDDDAWPILSGHTMRVWLCTVAGGKPRTLESHGALRWLGPDDLMSVEWLAPDIPIVEKWRAIQAGR